MKVLYDHQAFTYQNYGGVSRYYAELMAHFDLLGDARYDVPSIYTNNLYVKDSNFRNNNRFINYFLSTRLLKKINDVGHRFGYNFPYDHNRRKSVEMIRKNNFDIFHPTFFDDYFLKYIGEKPFVLTIHDMTHEKFPEHFPRNDGTAARKRELAMKAAGVIAISENTKEDILKFYDIGRDKVRVIYHGSSLTVKKVAGAPDEGLVSGLPGRYILFIGDRKAYKNFNFFMRSIAPILVKDAGLQIVCSGGGSFTRDEVSLLRSLGVEGRVRQHTVNDDTLVELYRRAAAYVNPSLYEGFGLPVLEAFACGCPAVISESSSLPEVGGDAAAYFNPGDASSIEHALHGVIYDDGLRERLRSRGYERLKKFSWEKTARETIELYRSVL